MKRLLLFLLLLSPFIGHSQGLLDSIAYESSVNTRFASGVGRTDIINMFLETREAIYNYGYKRHFADSAALVAAIPVGENGWFVLTDDKKIFAWLGGGPWAQVSGTVSGGGLSAVSSDASLDGDGTIGDPLTLADDAVTNTKIADGSVDVNKMAVASVGNANLVNNAVTSAKVADGTLTNSDLATMAAYTLKGNQDGSVSAPDDIDFLLLPVETSPTTGDILLIKDNITGEFKSLDYNTIISTLIITPDGTLQGDGSSGNPLGIADEDDNTIMGNISGGSAQPVALTDAVITEEVSPSSGDFVLGWDDAGNVRIYDVGNLPTGGGGEINTNTNGGTGGVGIPLAKSGVDTPLKSLISDDGTIDVTDDVGNNNIDFSLADNSVTSAKILTDAVTASEIASGAVGTSEVSDNSLTSDDLASGAVTNDEIAANEVDSVSLWQFKANQLLLNPTGSLADPQRITLPEITEDNTPVAGDWFLYHSIGNGLRRVNVSDMPGGGTVTGGLNVGNGEFGWFKQLNGATMEWFTFGTSGDDMISIAQQSDSLLFGIQDASIDGTKIANDVIDSQHYVAASIDNEHLALNSVESDNIVDGTIVTADIGADEIVNSLIADDQIDSEHYVDASIDVQHLGDIMVPFTLETTTSLVVDENDVTHPFGIARILYNPASTGTISVDSGTTGQIIHIKNISSQVVNIIKGTAISLNDPGSLSNEDQIAFLEWETNTEVLLKIENIGGSATITTSPPLSGDGSGGDPVTIASGAITGISIADDAISNDKIAEMTKYTFKGNSTGITANPTDFTFEDLTEKTAVALGSSEWIVVQNTTANGLNLSKLNNTAFLRSPTSSFTVGALAYGTGGTAHNSLTYNNNFILTANTLELFGDEATNPFGSTSPGTGVLRLNDKISTPIGTLGSGGLLYVEGQSLIFYDDAGTATDLVAAGVTTLGGLTNVDLTGEATNEGIFKSAGGDYVAQLVGTDNIASNAITSAKIPDGAVGNTELATDAVTAIKIGAGEVGTSELATNAVTTPDIINNAVDNTKIDDMAQNTIKGRITASTGDPEDLTATQIRTIINVTDGANNYLHPNHTGDVTSVGDGAQTIAANAVTNVKAADMAANSIKGNNGIIGDPEDLIATTLSQEFFPTTGDWAIGWDESGNLVKFSGDDLGETPIPIETRTLTTETFDEADITHDKNVLKVRADPTADANYTFDTGNAGDVIEFTNVSAFNITPVAGAGMTIQGTDVLDTQWFFAYFTWDASNVGIWKVENIGGVGGGGNAGFPTINDKIASYTAALADSNSWTNMNLGTATVFTIPDINFPKGAIMSVYREGAGSVEIQVAGSATLEALANIDGDYKINGQFQSITLVNQDGAKEWKGVGAWETDGVGQWINIPFATNWQNASGADAEYREIISNGELWVQFNGEPIEYTNASSVGISAFWDATSVGDITGAGTIHTMVRIDNGTVDREIVSMETLNTTDEFRIRSPGGGTTIGQNDTFYLPTEWIPIR